MEILDKIRKIAFFFLLMIAGLSAAWAESQVSEYQVKAAFLYHFGQFVEWPRSVFQSSKNSFSICVIGQDPFNGDLETMMKSKVIQSRSISIRRLQNKDNFQQCQILFISTSEKDSMAAILSSLQTSAILTVGEADGFLSKGGMIQWKVVEGKVRLMINQKIAEQAGLKISSKLLQLADVQ